MLKVTVYFIERWSTAAPPKQKIENKHEWQLHRATEALDDTVRPGIHNLVSHQHIAVGPRLLQDGNRSPDSFTKLLFIRDEKVRQEGIRQAESGIIPGI